MTQRRRSTDQGRIDPFASIVQTGAALRRGVLSPTTLARQMLARVLAEDPLLHAYLRVDDKAAAKAALRAEVELASGRDRGPLHGIPVAVKDNIFIAGQPCTDGSPAYAGFVPRRSAEVVLRLRRAGAVVLGSLHLHEGALAEHHPSFGPAPVSPFTPGMWPGGSSSGAGVATAAGLCFAALGTDTGGSIRYPAALNALTGLKPTYGRVPTAGVHPLAPSLDTVGPMARDARDARAVFSAITSSAGLRGPTDTTEYIAPDLQGLKVGIDERHVSARVDAEVSLALARALEIMITNGAKGVPVTMPPVEAALSAQIAVMELECAAYHGKRYLAQPAQFGQLGQLIERGLGLPSDTVVRGRSVANDLTTSLGQIFATVDVILLPVLPVTGISYANYHESFASYPDFGRFTAPYNLTGHPAVTFPVGLASNGLPIGVQVVGPRGADARLLEVAEAFQSVTTWHRTPPETDPPSSSSQQRRSTKPDAPDDGAPLDEGERQP